MLQSLQKMELEWEDLVFKVTPYKDTGDANKVMVMHTNTIIMMVSSYKDTGDAQELMKQ